MASVLIGRSSLPFASHQKLKILRGSFDYYALWTQAFVLRALQPAVCLHGPPFLGRSSLPFDAWRIFMARSQPSKA